MFRHSPHLALLVFCAITVLTCTPLDPFNESGNAAGTLSITSESGNNTDSLYIDSTNRPITFSATLFLTGFIDDAYIVLNYEDSSSDTLPLLSGESTEEHLTIDTTCTFERGGRITAYLIINGSDGAVHTDSAAVYLYRSPVYLCALRTDATSLHPDFKDTLLAYSALVSAECETVMFSAFTDNHHAAIRFNDSILLADSATPVCSLQTGLNSFSFEVIADDDSTISRYDVTITRKKRNVATLDSVRLSSGTLFPLFDPDSAAGYTVTLGRETDSLTITPFLTDTGAACTVNGRSIDKDHPSCTLHIDSGKTGITISVTAEDNETRQTYDITATRITAAAAPLKALTVSDGVLTPSFSPGIPSYTVELPYDDSTVTLSAIPLDSTAQVTVNSTVSPAAITLPTGYDTVTILVRSADTATTMTYTVIFTRKNSADTRLAAFTVSAGTLTPAFDNDIHEYALHVGDAIDTIIFSAVPVHDNASVKINGAASPATIIAQPMSNTPVSVVVTAADGTTKSNCTVTITRNGSSMALLAALEVSAGILEPAFHSDTTAYRLNIPADSGSIRLRPVSMHDRSTITVTGNSVSTGDWSPAIPVVQGDDNSCAVVITSENGKGQRTYTLTVSRAYRLSVSAGNGGSTEPDGTVESFTSAGTTVSAHPDEGFHFVQWSTTSGKAAITDEHSGTTSVFPAADAAVTAVYSRNRYVLTLTTDTEQGRAAGPDSLYHGIADTISAQPADGYHFRCWKVLSGDAVIADSTSAATTVTATTQPVAIEAVFTRIRYALTLADDGSCSVSESDSVTHGTPFTITAAPSAGYRFTGWTVTSGTAAMENSADASTTVTLSNGDATVTATCVRIRYVLTLSNNGDGTIDGSDSVYSGVPQTITAAPAPGNMFLRWQVTSGTATVTNDTACTTSVTLTSGDATVEAVFSAITFEKLYKPFNEAAGLSVVHTSDGGYVIGGKVLKSGTDNYDVLLVKTGCYGDTLWTRTFGGSGCDLCTSVRQTVDGGYILCGRTESFGSSSDLYCIKTDGNGIEEWSRTYGGDLYEYGAAVRQTADNGYILAGYSHSFGTRTYNDYYLVRITSSGDTVWTKTFDNGQDDWAYDVIQTTDGGYLVCGYSYLVALGRSEPDIFILKTDMNGDTLWTKAYGDADSYESVHSVRQTVDGGYIIAGNTNRSGNNDAYLLKTTGTGDTLWTKTYGGPARDYCYEVRVTDDGGYLCSGYYTNNRSVRNLYLFKTSSSGTVVWERIMTTTATVQGHSVDQSPGGGFIVTGSSDESLFLTKTDADGLIY